jgi:hypothetical protein
VTNFKALTRRLSPVLFVLVVSAAAVTAGMSGRASAEPSRTSFSDLRVCGATSFSRSQSHCTRDERRLHITSNRISCSVTLFAKEPGVWRTRFTYDGHVDPWTTGGKVVVGTNLLWHNTNVGTNLPVPGGSWGCEFSFQTTKAALAFKSGGPTGQIVDAAVCPASDVLSRHALRRCAKDNSGTPLPGSERIYCSAVYAHPTSDTAKIEVLTADGTLIKTTNLRIGKPTVSQGFGFVNSSKLKSHGRYLCRFTLGNGTTVVKRFRIGATARP